VEQRKIHPEKKWTQWKDSFMIPTHMKEAHRVRPDLLYERR
jgi:hypothetical protein